jgi:hypothetical protein
MKLGHNSPLLVVAGLMLWVQTATAQTVVLPGAVSVTGDEVRLSDLLPRGAPDELQRASQGIVLGEAPRPGSLRGFESDAIRARLAAHPDIAKRLVVPDRVLVTRSGYRLAATDIRDTVLNFLRSRSDVEELPETVLQWASDISATGPNPGLEVRAASLDASRGRLQLCLRCVKPAACRDFLVYVPAPQSIMAQFSHGAGGTASLASKTTSTGGAIDGPLLIEAGRKARLLLQGEGLQISVGVICLESGRAGEEIRVRETSGGRVFRAKVMGRDLLWGRLES